MYSKKNITIGDEGVEYEIGVDLYHRRVDSCLLRSVGAEEWSITSLGQLPDKVQIHFYKIYKRLINDYLVKTRAK